MGEILEWYLKNWSTSSRLYLPTHGRTNMAKSTRLDTLIYNIYIAMLYISNLIHPVQRIKIYSMKNVQFRFLAILRQLSRFFFNTLRINFIYLSEILSIHFSSFFWALSCMLAIFIIVQTFWPVYFFVFTWQQRFCNNILYLYL